MDELDENLSKLRQYCGRTAPTRRTRVDLPDQHFRTGTVTGRPRSWKSWFSHLSPWDEVLLARHKNRPYTLDYVSAHF